MRCEFISGDFAVVLYYKLKECMLAKLLQSYPTLCDTMDCSPPGLSICSSFPTTD